MPVLDILAKLRGGKKAPGAADIQAAIDRIALPGLREGVLRLEAERRAALLEGRPEAELDALESQLRRAQTEAERGAIAVDDLSVKLDEARRSEAKAALDADLAKLGADARAKAREVGATYDKAGGEIVQALRALDDLQQRITDLNQRLVAAGRAPEQLPPAEHLAFGRFSSFADEVVSARGCTSLRPTAGMPGFGEASDRFAILGADPAKAERV